MSEFVTNMFQYNATVGITRSEVINLISSDNMILDPAVPLIFALELSEFEVSFMRWFRFESNGGIDG